MFFQHHKTTILKAQRCLCPPRCATYHRASSRQSRSAGIASRSTPVWPQLAGSPVVLGRRSGSLRPRKGPAQSTPARAVSSARPPQSAETAGTASATAARVRGSRTGCPTMSRGLPTDSQSGDRQMTNQPYPSPCSRVFSTPKKHQSNTEAVIDTRYCQPGAVGLPITWSIPSRMREWIERPRSSAIRASAACRASSR